MNPNPVSSPEPAVSRDALASEIYRQVTMLTFEFPPCYGGVSRMCGALADGLRSSGLRVDLVTDAAYGLKTTQVLDSIVSTGPGLRAREWPALRHLRAQTETGPVVCAMWYQEGLIATLAGVKPRVVLAHGAELMPGRTRWREPVWGRLRRWTLESAELVIANSEYTLGLVLKAAPKAKVVALPLGVDHNRFSPGDRESARQRFGLGDRIVISTVARLFGFKGHSTVMQALAAMPESERARITYMIAGPGPERENLEKLSRDLGIAEQVRFLGFFPDGDLPDVYRASDLFVLCTREDKADSSVEGFGLVFLEAQACGTPVVGTRTGGIPDAISEGDGGWMIAQDDVAALSGILRRLVGDPDFYRAAGLAARARVERECTWAQYTGKFIQCLEANGLRLGVTR